MQTDRCLHRIPFKMNKYVIWIVALAKNKRSTCLLLLYFFCFHIDFILIHSLLVGIEQKEKKNFHLINSSKTKRYYLHAFRARKGTKKKQAAGIKISCGFSVVRLQNRHNFILRRIVSGCRHNQYHCMECCGTAHNTISCAKWKNELSTGPNGWKSG